jgi:hypothetical protein
MNLILLASACEQTIYSKKNITYMSVVLNWQDNLSVLH